MEKIRFRNKYSYTKLLLVMFGYPRLELAHFLGLADNDVLSEVEDPVSYTHLTLPTKA